VRRAARLDLGSLPIVHPRSSYFYLVDSNAVNLARC
jgi:hypothetical protein